MKKTTLRSGIVGTGFAASFHFEALKRVFGVDVEITGVYSRNEERRVSFAEKRRIPVRSSLDELIKNADVVHVCAPGAAHEPITLQALEQDRSVIVEKPLTGYFGEAGEELDGRNLPKARALEGAIKSVEKILSLERRSSGKVMYAENWVYAPGVQKEREIIEKTGAQILWMHGEESHSGSHSQDYGFWSRAGGGSMMGKACHPLTAALYLKQIEGKKRNGRPIRPKAVSARTHEITRLKGYIDKQHLRTDYHDVEDFSFMHVIFEDGSLADVYATELVLGGVHNWLEICSNNHRSVIRINPNDSLECYNPRDENFQDIYVVEKIGTKQGWSKPSPDEDWFTGYYQEMEAFYRDTAAGEESQSNSRLAADTIATIYSAYVSAEQKGREYVIPALPS